MSNLLVNDLEFNQELDRQAMTAVNGGGIVSWFKGKIKSAGKYAWKKRADIALGIIKYFLGTPQRPQRRPF